MEKLVRAASQAGYRTAVIKHDGHSFSADTPGTDTARQLQAGACGAAVFDGEKFQLVRRAQTDEQQLMELFPEAQVVFLEGFKHSAWPKIEVVRGDAGPAPVCEEETLLALYSDIPLQSCRPIFSFQETEELIRWVLSWIKKEEKRCWTAMAEK